MLVAADKLLSRTKPVQRMMTVNIVILHSVPKYLEKSPINNDLKTVCLFFFNIKDQGCGRKKKTKQKINHICKYTGTFLRALWCQIQISEHLFLKTNAYYSLLWWSVS